MKHTARRIQVSNTAEPNQQVHQQVGVNDAALLQLTVLCHAPALVAAMP